MSFLRDALDRSDVEIDRLQMALKHSQTETQAALELNALDRDRDGVVKLTYLSALLLSDDPDDKEHACLAIAAIGSAVAAGMARGPKEGAAVFVGVLVIGLLFGALLRPPPLRDRPGDGAAIDFGRIDDASGGGGGTQDRSPSRAERRREAKGQRRS